MRSCCSSEIFFGWKRITAISKVASISRLSVEETGYCFEEGCHDHAPKSIPKRQRAKIEPKKAHRAPKSAPRSALHTPCTKMEPKNGGPHTKNDPKKAHRAPKSAHTKIEPKNDAPCTEIGPKIGAPHTAHQNPSQKQRTAHQNLHQKRRTAHQNRARKGAPRTKIHPKGHHAPRPRPHIRQVSGSIPLGPLQSCEPKKAHRAPKSARKSAHHTPRTKIEPKNGAPRTKI